MSANIPELTHGRLTGLSIEQIVSMSMPEWADVVVRRIRVATGREVRFDHEATQFVGVGGLMVVRDA